MNRSHLDFQRRLPLVAAYAKDHGWQLQTGSRGKRFLVKGKFKYSMSMTPSDRNADKVILRQLKKFDATGDVYGRAKETFA